MSERTIKLGRAWHRALNAVTSTSNPGPKLIEAEQQAWDAYSDACDDINECLQIDCQRTVFETSYCDLHKE